MSDERNDQALKEIGVGIIGLIVFVPFFAQVGEIYVDPSDPGFGSQDFPKLILSMGLLFSLFLVGKNFIGHFGGKRKIAIDWQAFTLRSKRPLAIVGVASLYVWAITLFQYALPTFALLVFLIRFFGSRGKVRALLVPLITVLVYFFIFFVLFGIFEEPGSILSYDSYTLTSAIRGAFGLH